MREDKKVQQEKVEKVVKDVEAEYEKRTGVAAFTPQVRKSNKMNVLDSKSFQRSSYKSPDSRKKSRSKANDSIDDISPDVNLENQN